MSVVPGLLVPTAAATLVVPAATVAEIVTQPPRVRPLPGVEPWVLGYFIWRNYPVTLISFERLAAGSEPATFSRVCVFYPLPGRATYDYFALGMNGDPRGMEIPDTAESGDLPAEMSSRFVAGAVKINDHTLVIPDFDALKTVFYPDQ